jgi:CRP-like cAMP-binding protein
VVELASVTTLPTLYATVRRCVQATSDFFVGLRRLEEQKGSEPDQGAHELLTRVLNYLASKSDQSKGYQVLGEDKPYLSGRFFNSEEKGVYLYNGVFGQLQVGIPPETIKTYMSKGQPVPTIYVLPPRLFVGAVNFGEVEFPIYFNFFIKKAFQNPDLRVIMIGTEEQLEKVRVSFQESVFGPEQHHLYVDDDIGETKKAEGYKVDFSAERGFLAYKDKSGSQPPLSHFADFKVFNERGEVDFTHKYEDAGEAKSVQIRVVQRNHLLQVYEDGVLGGIMETNASDRISANHPGGNEKADEPVSLVPFEPPVFGITFIGTSHGFDAKGRTTGFIIWLNGYGVLVDPPMQTTDFLRRHGIHHRFVTKVILTHCHSDHDSGVIQMILEGEKIELYTTRTVNESYKRKVNAITGLADVGEYYTFRPVLIGDKVPIHGAEFEFDYSFHTVPTVRFKLSFLDKSISYSSDTYYNPQALASLVSQGIINYQREISLRMFLFDADLIIHESGVPTIHTAISDLNNLPESIKKKMYIVHCSGIPDYVETETSEGNKLRVKVTHLKRPQTEETVALAVSRYAEGYSRASLLFKMFCDVWYFRNLSPSRVSRLFTACIEETRQPGDVIVREGEITSRFYLIVAGVLDVYQEEGEQRRLVRSLGRGQFFGESALGGDSQAKRTATVVARTGITLLALPSSTFRESQEEAELAYVHATSVEVDLERVRKYRQFVCRSLCRSYLFSSLYGEQLEAIAASIEDKELVYHKDEVVFKQGDLDSSFFLIWKGSIRLEKSNSDAPAGAPDVEFMRLGVGDSFGEMSLITGLPRSATAVACEETTLLELNRARFQSLLAQYQNIRYHVMHVVSERLKESQMFDEHIRKRAASPSRSVPKE